MYDAQKVSEPYLNCLMICPNEYHLYECMYNRSIFGCAVYYDAYCVFCCVVLVRKPSNALFFFVWFDKETCPRGKEVLPQLRNELNCLKEDVIQLRARKRQLTQMLLFLTVVFIAFVGVWLMGCL
jgi:hypothetical protein